ncbi:monovalent cation/H(+) antiporter subunit G [Nannocystis sp. ILAH1]|uniref:monovalent cation/H(+) antiporter subunit G n=1 Tax=unclassified Nannocystis TaxID=2627009 RepID=UPI00226D6303|nr:MULTISPECIES: monovalent cation/H(+) antiporter subunit G [unclassified Nannocystis]MCY0990065.1 monovalent cation/H(+) antiporter subunit G [Nannocystis sp. ILAH1]MCY0994970.1 monovalent cation/H(+) antiporter subunit G [Nannocystis sp. ILAH1]MCY1069646.1 monovalent cation/H(+) antiporter subunit G [Nannocystis sp. RBIL2]
MHWNEVVCTVLLALGCVISFSGSYGVLKFPDFYARLHAAGKTDSLAQVLILLGLVFVTPDVLTQVKLMMVAFILLIVAPTATFAITKAAHLDGLRPWTRGGGQ